jgi:hypothetical protein
MTNQEQSEEIEKLRSDYGRLVSLLRVAVRENDRFRDLLQEARDEIAHMVENLMPAESRSKSDLDLVHNIDAALGAKDQP